MLFLPSFLLTTLTMAILAFAAPYKITFGAHSNFDTDGPDVGSFPMDKCINRPKFAVYCCSRRTNDMKSSWDYWDKLCRPRTEKCM